MTYLADYGVDFNARDRENWTPLHLAVKRGNVSAIKRLFEVAGNKPKKSWMISNGRESGNFVDIDTPGGPKNMTALHLASEKNFYTIVDLLFQHKADIF